MSTHKHSFNNSIYTASPNTVNTGIGGTVTIPADLDLDGTITTSTITASTAAPTITWNGGIDDLGLDLDSSITIGDYKITEDVVRDLLIMLEVIKELDDSNPIKDMFNTIKMLDEIKGKKNLDLPK